MKYSKYIDAVAQKTGLSKSDVKKALDASTEVLSEALVAKDSVSIPGVGVFSTKENPPRKGRNPATGETIDIAAKTVVKFKVAKALTDAVKG